jgi:hypothetical protein
MKKTFVDAALPPALSVFSDFSNDFYPGYFSRLDPLSIAENR